MSTMPDSINFSPMLKADVSKPKSKSIVTLSSDQNAKAIARAKARREAEIANSEKIEKKTKHFRDSATRSDPNVGNHIDVTG